MSKLIKLYTLNMCSLLYVNHTSKKLFKKESYIISNIFSPSCPLSFNFIFLIICKFSKNIYSFIGLCWVLVEAHGIYSLHCGIWDLVP